MKFALPLVLLAAGVATAQSATSPASSSNAGNSVCDAEYIVDVCLNSELKKVHSLILTWSLLPLPVYLSGPSLLSPYVPPLGPAKTM